MGDEEYKRGTNWWDSCSGDVRTGGASSDSMGGGFRSMLEQGMEAEPMKGFSVDQQFVDTSCSSVYGNFQPQQQGDDGAYVANYETHHQFLKPNSMEDWNMPPPASSFFPLAMQQHQINIPCFHQKPQHTSGPGRKTSGSSSEQTTTTTTTAAGKRSRNEASSALPPFKVRKEKMGDRITALQQLVSPFGKTDTASVLSEAIEYIKFLHEQVNVLSTSYLKSGASLQHQQSSDKSKDPEGARQDLRSRGLCLVPVSSTFPVAHGTTVDFWTPTFGGTFR